MKNIISYSLWGTNNRYIDPLLWNAVHINEFFPGWIIRVYYDDTVPKEAINGLKNCELIQCPVGVNYRNLFYRFLPFADKTVNKFIVRDSEYEFDEKETWYVNDWIKSGKPFHLLRTHESNRIPILGGRWGAIPRLVNVENFENRMNDFIKRHEIKMTEKKIFKNGSVDYYGYDQLFLFHIFWRTIKDNHLAHIKKGFPGIKYTSNDVEI